MKFNIDVIFKECNIIFGLNVGGVLEIYQKIIGRMTQITGYHFGDFNEPSKSSSHDSCIYCWVYSDAVGRPYKF